MLGVCLVRENRDGTWGRGQEDVEICVSVYPCQRLRPNLILGARVGTKPHPRSKGRNQTSSSMYTDLNIKEYHQQLKYEKKGH